MVGLEGVWARWIVRVEVRSIGAGEKYLRRYLGVL